MYQDNLLVILFGISSLQKKLYRHCILDVTATYLLKLLCKLLNYSVSEYNTFSQIKLLKLTSFCKRVGSESSGFHSPSFSVIMVEQIFMETFTHDNLAHLVPLWLYSKKGCRLEELSYLLCQVLHVLSTNLMLTNEGS